MFVGPNKTNKPLRINVSRDLVIALPGRPTVRVEAQPNEYEEVTDVGVRLADDFIGLTASITDNIMTVTRRNSAQGRNNNWKEHIYLEVFEN